MMHGDYITFSIISDHLDHLDQLDLFRYISYF